MAAIGDLNSFWLYNENIFAYRTLHLIVAGYWISKTIVLYNAVICYSCQ